MTEAVLDNRGLKPPEPLVRTLRALGELNDGDRLKVMMDREPLLLFPELERRGWEWESREEAGVFILHIFRPGERRSERPMPG